MLVSLFDIGFCFVGLAFAKIIAAYTCLAIVAARNDAPMSAPEIGLPRCDAASNPLPPDTLLPFYIWSHLF